ncbi:heterokaryon incompatibility protein-domain-containing protein [Hypoxylon sp. FL1150]|nr:heterokaryon incompatibility protein-domain-containing protein [Hypoxylon sp. FL1150]
MDRLWGSVKKICFYSFAMFLTVWFWLIGPLFYSFVIAISVALRKLYWVLWSYPLRILRRWFFQASQLTGDIQGSIFYSLGVTKPYSFVQDIVWIALESSIADYLAIAIEYTRTSIEAGVARTVEWLGSWLVTVLFYIPPGAWKVIFAVFGSLMMLGGAGTALMVYCVFRVSHQDTFGLDYLNEQRLKLEGNMAIYQQLLPGQIRVLLLQPGPPGSPIRCELRTTTLDGNTQYEALSYVWGNLTMDRRIYVNQERISITHSLHRALIHLRHETRIRVLWVDALCINQTNIQEREAQVSRIYNIYNHATRVVVWLNTAPFGIRQAFQAAQRNKLPTDYHFGTVRVVSKILASPWWMRVWVVQEFIVAKSVVIQCSDYTIEWDDFCGLVDSAIGSFCFDPNGTYLDEYHALREQRRFRTLNTSGNDLLELLFAFRMKHATDPRDKIFAFLSLSNIGVAQGDDDTVVRADYVTEPEKVFQDCTVKLINASRSLSILALTECTETSYLRKELSSWHTWCPQWSSHGNHFRATPFWTGSHNYNQPWAASRFSAAGGVPAPLCPIIDDMLQLSGWPADEVVAVGQTADVSRIEIIKMLEKGAGSIIGVLNAWRNWVKVLPQWKKLAETSTRCSRDVAFTERAFYTAITAGLYRDNMPLGTQYNNLVTDMKAASFGRTFFVTASGRLGLGPGGTVPGDKVYILLGSDVPVILRSVPESSGLSRKTALTTGGRVAPQLYAGQAYVHELMTYHGDLQKDLDEGRQAVEDVYIR